MIELNIPSREKSTGRPVWCIFFLVAILLASGVPAGAAQKKPLRIMCLGDSITVGYTDNPHWKVPFKFGYRSRLYKLLKGAGYHFTFVG
ncbi:MAG: hypothetical protein ACPIG6_11140, partial [Akkermansiaceae bacterium]